MSLVGPSPAKKPSPPTAASMSPPIGIVTAAAVAALFKHPDAVMFMQVGAFVFALGLLSVPPNSKLPYWEITVES